MKKRITALLATLVLFGMLCGAQKHKAVAEAARKAKLASVLSRPGTFLIVLDGLIIDDARQIIMTVDRSRQRAAEVEIRLADGTSVSFSVPEVRVDVSGQEVHR
jgi:hypothetical protein